MTTTSLWRIGADIPDKTRAFLLRRFPPKFAEVHCRSLTHGYRVPIDHPFPEGALKIDIYGYHRCCDEHESLLVRVNGQTFQPDGNQPNQPFGCRYFVALSSAHGVQPFRCAEVDSDSIVHFDDILSLNGLRFKRFPLWERKPEKRAA